MKDMSVFNGIPGSTLEDLDFIQEVITTDLVPHLPGPPAPPADLLCQQLGTNHRMLQQSSSPPSEPILVSRGTARQPTCAFPQPLQQSCSSREMASGHSFRGNTSRRARGASRSLSSKAPVGLSQAQTHSEMLEHILEKPKLVVVEEPKERGMRFRYECEGRSAGSILGTSSTESNKTQPAVEIQGPIDHINKVIVTVSLVTKDFPHRPHPHCLVGKDCPDGTGICMVTFNPHSNRRHSFSNLGIQCVKRKDLDDSLQKRRSQNVDPFQTGHSKGIEDMDMNAVRLCFQCELEWDNGRKDCLNPLVSNPIFDKKATTTSQLKISCLNLYRGPCTGKTEVYMLCDKVQKDDIEIIFRRGSWKASGEFAQTDVHRQIAIVFKTPPYQDQDMTEEVEVSIFLRRLSDQMESEPISFTYLPCNPDPYGVKRKIKSDIHFRNKSCVTAKRAAEAEPLSSQPFQFPPSQSMSSPEERLCTTQPGTSTSGDICCNVVEPNFSSEDITILNQLLDIPELWDVFPKGAINQPVASGFDQGLETNAMFANVDANFNPNFEPYTQDFSHYSDVQFSMLVNENQSSHSEPQDSPSHMVQVKVEEEP